MRRRLKDTVQAADHPDPRGTVYCITVKGLLDPSWSERLAGMQVLPEENRDSPGGKTTLLGLIRDEAELFGVLNTLFDLRLPILKVELRHSEESKP